MHWLGTIVLALGAISFPARGDVTVFAAASLKEALDAQARAFERSTGERIVAVYGASYALARQIDSGAPADLFIAADVDSMNYLAERHLVDNRIVLLRNRLVLIAPAGSTAELVIAPGFPLASVLRNDRLAMGNPDSVPAGRYAKHALQSLGVWESVANRVARTENVRAALALVARGEAPLGIVYATDALAERRVRMLGTFPVDSHAPIVYPAAVVSGSKSSRVRAFLDFLASAAARGTWLRYGFALDG